MNAAKRGAGFRDPMAFVHQPPTPPVSTNPPPPEVVGPPEPGEGESSLTVELAEAAHDARAEPPAAPKPTPEPETPAEHDEPVSDLYSKARAPKETVPANYRFPIALHKELRQFWKDTDIPMSEVVIEGTRRFLAELKAQRKKGKQR